MNEKLYKKANDLLKSIMDREFSRFLKTERGKVWQEKYSSRGTKSPYEFGMTIPAIVSDIIEAMNTGDETAISNLMAS